MIALCILLNFYCKDRFAGDRGENTPPDLSTANDQIATRDSLTTDSLAQNKKTKIVSIKDSIKIPVISFRKAKTIEILSLIKETSNWENTTEEETKACNTWSLTKDQIKAMIRQFEQVASEEINYAYEYWPCRLTGKLKVDSITYKYFLNAGSHLTLIKDDPGGITFVYCGKKGKKLFLSGEIDMAAEEDKQLRQEGKYPNQ